MKINNYFHDFLTLGAGVAGLAAGIELKKKHKDNLIIKKDSQPGGLNQTSTVGGCDFDFGPKILLLDESENSQEILAFLEGNSEKYPVIERAYLSPYGLLGFPLQRYLIDLPTSEQKMILNDLKKAQKSPREVKSYKDWLINGFGEYFCQLVLFPYEEKKWQTDLDQMDYKWALKRPIKVDYDEIVKGSQVQLPSNKFYYYPKVGSISVLTQAMQKVAGRILLETEVESINLEKKFVETNKGKFYYNFLISSLPLDYFVEKTVSLPEDLKSKSKNKLKRLSIIIFNLVFDGRYELDGTAIYFPEKKFNFRRVSILQNLCPALARKHRTPISVEMSINEDEEKELQPQVILDQILANFKQIEGLKNLEKLINWEMLKVDFAYPLQLNGLLETVKEIQEYYKKYNVFHCGRGGNFDYCNSDQAYKQGKEIARELLNRAQTM